MYTIYINKNQIETFYLFYIYFVNHKSIIEFKLFINFKNVSAITFIF